MRMATGACCNLAWNCERGTLAQQENSREQLRAPSLPLHSRCLTHYRAQQHPTCWTAHYYTWIFQLLLPLLPQSPVSRNPVYHGLCSPAQHLQKAPNSFTPSNYVSHQVICSKVMWAGSAHRCERPQHWSSALHDCWRHSRGTCRSH